MVQLILGIVIGVVTLAVIGGLAWLVASIHSLASHISAGVNELQRTTQAFSKSADMTAAFSRLEQTNKELILAVNGMSGAVGVFTGLILPTQQADGEDDMPPYPPPPDSAPATTPRMPAWRPPVPPLWSEEMPSDIEAGILSQDDEDLTEIETQRESEERGEPTVADILALRKEQDVRGEV